MELIVSYCIVALSAFHSCLLPCLQVLYIWLYPTVLWLSLPSTHAFSPALRCCTSSPPATSGRLMSSGVPATLACCPAARLMATSASTASWVVVRKPPPPPPHQISQRPSPGWTPSANQWLNLSRPNSRAWHSRRPLSGCVGLLGPLLGWVLGNRLHSR